MMTEVFLAKKQELEHLRSEEKWLKLEKNWLSAPTWLETPLKWVEHRSRRSLLNSRKGTRHGCRVTGQTVFRSVASLVLLHVTFCKTYKIECCFPFPGEKFCSSPSSPQRPVGHVKSCRVLSKLFEIRDFHFVCGSFDSQGSFGDKIHKMSECFPE